MDDFRSNPWNALRRQIADIKDDLAEDEVEAMSKNTQAEENKNEIFRCDRCGAK